MEEELEKRLFVYRRCFKYYGNVSNAFLVSKFIIKRESQLRKTLPFFPLEKY